MWISYPNLLACLLLPVCGLGLFLLLLADNWHVQTRIKLAFLLVLLACAAVMAMH